ncbi:hypothetical protein HYPSUDRAFT_44414 [Hypholoma sublateritium FD-334 SS-4]|uniref:MARVEL domain-containing protein n=1 Tax=Hypholoma sublateritium (strain FD-334 SS-4) TaxID=945553 RepID=A0A0D2NJX5_HYPSF|nr:hypothetical protein HYPSUDRAFT_44414 [Hypholoma sublateritium FD-334 SS-4]
MAFDSAIQIGHPIAFGMLLVFSIIEMCISAWITAKYNAHHNFPNTGTRARVRYILFTSIWTIIFGSVYMAVFLVAVNHVLSSIASHVIFLSVTWILWLAAAAAITQTLGGSLNCANDSFFVYCGQLNALEGFAWLIWVLLTLILIAVLIRGIVSAKNGSGFQGGLVDEV